MNMKKILQIIPAIILGFLVPSFSNGQGLVLLSPTGEFDGKYPLMEKVSDTSATSRKVNEIIDNSAIKDILGIYAIGQAYMKNVGRTSSIEPSYLALTQNQGGYAKQGF